MRGFFATLTAVCILLCASLAQPFPDAEITGITGGPPLSLGFTDNPTSFITKDNGTLIVTYGQVMRIVDLGLFALAATQPIDTSADDDDDNDSPFNAAYYAVATDQVLISQERGYVVIYSLADLTENPVYGEVLAGKSLGPLVTNDTGTTAYITNNTDRTIHVFSIVDRSVSNTITVGDLPNNQSSYSFTAGIFVDGSDEAYFATDKGGVIVLPDGGTAVTIIDVATNDGDNLAGLAALSDDSYVYVTNKTKSTIAKIEVSSHTVNKTIDVTENASLEGVVITAVTNPTGTYAYVAGGQGVTIIDTIKDALDECPPEIVADLMESGVTLAGGGALLRGLDRRLSDELHVRVWVAEDPMTCVVRGASMILEDYEHLAQFLVGLERGSTHHV